jgi:hypothetical protein
MRTTFKGLIMLILLHGTILAQGPGDEVLLLTDQGKSIRGVLAERPRDSVNVWVGRNLVSVPMETIEEFFTSEATVEEADLAKELAILGTAVGAAVGWVNSDALSLKERQSALLWGWASGSMGFLIGRYVKFSRDTSTWTSVPLGNFSALPMFDGRGRPFLLAQLRL